MKLFKYLFFLVLLGVICAIYFGGSSSLLDKINAYHSVDRPCAFCDEKIIARQQFFEGKAIRALLNYKPLLEGHTLIIPKRHVERYEDLNAEELVEMKDVIRKVQLAFQKVYGTADFLLVCQNGKAAGQTEFHVHFHMIPRGEEGVGLLKAKLWLAFVTEVLALRKPLAAEELQSQVDNLKMLMSET